MFFNAITIIHTWKSDISSFQTTIALGHNLAMSTPTPGKRQDIIPMAVITSIQIFKVRNCLTLSKDLSFVELFFFIFCKTYMMIYMYRYLKTH